MFLAELNNMELWGADVGNASRLDSPQGEDQLYIVGGSESEELQGHVLVMYKALYGRSGCLMMINSLTTPHHMGFKPSRAPRQYG